MHGRRKTTMPTTRGRWFAMSALSVVSVLAVTGCTGPAPWDAGGSGGRTATPQDTPSASASVPAPVPNDLSSGSTQRVLTAGPVTATVDYWSTLDMSRWSAGAIKPVSISLKTTVEPDDGQKVFLQKATMVALPSDGADIYDALGAQTDQSTVAPGYLVIDPYSYSQVFNVGSVPAETTMVTLQFTYDFLVQTTPTSSEYAKQTTTDTLTVAINRPAPDDTTDDTTDD